MLQRAIELLSDRVMFFYKKETLNEKKWAKQVRKAYKAMKKMEEYKTTQPKISEIFYNLQLFLRQRFVSVCSL